jgi:hypothetical protein
MDFTGKAGLDLFTGQGMLLFWQLKTDIWGLERPTTYGMHWALGHNYPWSGRPRGRSPGWVR